MFISINLRILCIRTSATRTCRIQNHVVELAPDVAVLVLPEDLVVVVLLPFFPHTDLGPSVPASFLHVDYLPVHLTLDEEVFGRPGDRDKNGSRCQIQEALVRCSGFERK